MDSTTATIHEVSDMRTGRITALVVGCLLIIPSVAMLIGAAALGIGAAVGRGDDGYFTVMLDDVSTPTAAVTSGSADFTTEPGNPDWAIDRLDADIRLRATSLEEGRNVFLGIAETRDVEAFLDGIVRDEITEIDNGRPVYTRIPGDDTADAPTEQDFWVAAAWGAATQEITWEATSGRWTAVLMNADGTPGVAADLQVGAKAGFVVPLAVTVGVLGLVLTAIAVVLIGFGVRRARPDRPLPSPSPDGLIAADTPNDPPRGVPHPSRAPVRRAGVQPGRRRDRPTTASTTRPSWSSTSHPRRARPVPTPASEPTAACREPGRSRSGRR